jgi:hypothetical protein
MKKILLNESERKAAILDREKAIVENFAKTFNKIKRLDENEDQTNSVIANLNNVFKSGGNYDVFNQLKNIYDHFMNGGEINNLEPNLKNVYLRHYKMFTKEQFMEICKKVDTGSYGDFDDI